MKSLPYHMNVIYKHQTVRQGCGSPLGTKLCSSSKAASTIRRITTPHLCANCIRLKVTIKSFSSPSEAPVRKTIWNNRKGKTLRCRPEGRHDSQSKVFWAKPAWSKVQALINCSSRKRLFLTKTRRCQNRKKLKCPSSQQKKWTIVSCSDHQKTR